MQLPTKLQSPYAAGTGQVVSESQVALPLIPRSR
jgi:hypothetical protein